MSDLRARAVPSWLQVLQKKNPAAAALIEDMWNVAEVWDDTVDGDHRHPEVKINRAFLWSLIGREENQFARDNPGLALVLKAAVAMWLAANALEKRGDEPGVRAAYTLRCSPYVYFVAVVAAASGVAEAAHVAVELFGDDSDDPFDAYMKEHLEVPHGMETEGTQA